MTDNPDFGDDEDECAVRNQNNAALVCAVRNALPSLLDRVEELEESQRTLLATIGLMLDAAGVSERADMTPECMSTAVENAFAALKAENARLRKVEAAARPFADPEVFAEGTDPEIVKIYATKAEITALRAALGEK